MTTCEHCQRETYARGLCSAHYAADWRSRNPERSRLIKTRWRKANPERQAEATAAWSKRNPERHRASIATWRAQNAGARAMHEAARRARIKGNGVFLVTDRDLRRMLHRYRYACAYCGTRLRGKVQWDHVLPIARGGRHSIGNLLPACAGCNSHKTQRLLIQHRITSRKAHANV